MSKYRKQDIETLLRLQLGEAEKAKSNAQQAAERLERERTCAETYMLIIADKLQFLSSQFSKLSSGWCEELVNEVKRLQTAHTALRGLVEQANYELAALFPVPDRPTFENAFTVCGNKNTADARCILNAYEAIHEAATLPREGGAQL